MAAVKHFTCFDCEKTTSSLHQTKLLSSCPESPFLEDQVLDMIAFYEAHISPPNGTIDDPGSSLTVCQLTSPFASENEGDFLTPTAYYFSAGEPDCPFVEAQVINDIKDFETHIDMKPSQLCCYSIKRQLEILKQQHLFQLGAEIEGEDVPSDVESYASYMSHDPRAIERSRHLRQHLAHMANFPAQDTA